MADAVTADAAMATAQQSIPAIANININIDNDIDIDGDWNGGWGNIDHPIAAGVAVGAVVG